MSTLIRPVIHATRVGQALKRNSYDVILIDQLTATNDNPDLYATEGHPLRVVIGFLHSLPLHLTLFTDQFKRNTMIVTTDTEARVHSDVIRTLEKNGIALLALKENENGRVDLQSMLRTFSSLKFTSILIEQSDDLVSEMEKLGLIDAIV